MDYYVKNYGFEVGDDISLKLIKLFFELQAVESEKKLIFEEGVYHLYSENCTEKLLNITNTIGEKEYQNGELPNKRRVGFFIENIENLSIIGNNTTFIIHGTLTNFAIINCRNIKLIGIKITTENPDVHQFTLVKKGLFYCDFELNKSSKYIYENGNYYFVGDDYKTSFKENATVSDQMHLFFPANDFDATIRSYHPFFRSIKIQELKPYLFRVQYLINNKYKLNDKICVFSCKRKNVGIFLDRCENVLIDKISQTFNYSLAIVAQLCKNLTVTNCNFASEGDIRLCSVADFIQVCCCRGLIDIENNNFAGSGDDILNVHGIHLKVVDINENKIVVRFMHHQTYGFNPFFPGNTIDYINSATLLPMGNACVTDSRLINPYEIELIVDNPIENKSNVVVENTSFCPDLIFKNNKISQCSARGILVTTRGNVQIKDNLFQFTDMSHILFSDDANSWYESSMVKTVTIENNTFRKTNAYNILILPENGNTKTIVHGDFFINNNNFDTKTKGGIFAKNSRSLILHNNKISSNSSNFLKTDNIEIIKITK